MRFALCAYVLASAVTFSGCSPNEEIRKADAMQAYLQGIHYSFGTDDRKQDLHKAYLAFRKGARLGGTGAMVSLGGCYRHGDGVEQDLSQAVYWYRKAAEMGHPDDMVCLGHCYRDGAGVDRDPAQAVAWYRKMLEARKEKLGYENVKKILGDCYRDGAGVAKDLTQAAYWYRRAVDGDDKDAQQALDDLAKQTNSFSK